MRTFRSPAGQDEKDDLALFGRVIRKVIANLDGVLRKAAAKSDD